jgi:trans-2,3-dihydro-3-hydroxyanthranilate isomerase
MSTWTAAGSTRNWAQVDVFAERAYEGNMLAIFTDGRGLSDEQMQALARETNLSETTFILPATESEEREHGVHVRIFTVEEELPFAGHPTLGTASWLWANHPLLRGSDEVRLRLQVGTIPVRFRRPVAEEAGVYGEMQQRDPVLSAQPASEAIARACGLALKDLDATWKPQVVSTGLPFCIVPLASLDALQRLLVDAERLDRALAGTGAKFIYAITPHDGAWRARMPFHGADDPATGSAAGCAISYLVRHGAVPSGTATTILQGIEVHRPSRIDVRASLREGSVTNVFVGGRTIPVATGLFTHP